MYVDVGCNGRVSDRGVVTTDAACTKHCKLPSLIFPTTPLPGQKQPLPCFFAPDNAWPRDITLQYKPFPFKGIVNCRLSIADRILENMFGIIANTFRDPRKSLTQSLHKHCQYCASSLCSAQFSAVNTRTAVFLRVSTNWIIDTKCTDRHS